MITLRAFHSDDEARLVELANNVNVTRFLRDQFPRPYTTIDARYWIEEGSCDRHGQHFAVCLHGLCIGSIGVFWGEREYRYSAEVGYWLGQPYWGKGYASEALAQLQLWLEENTQLHRLYALVLECNPASMRVLEKNGYAREGILRHAVMKDGAFYDEHLFARVQKVDIS